MDILFTYIHIPKNYRVDNEVVLVPTTHKTDAQGPPLIATLVRRVDGSLPHARQLSSTAPTYKDNKDNIIYLENLKYKSNQNCHTNICIPHQPDLRYIPATFNDIANILVYSNSLSYISILNLKKINIKLVGRTTFSIENFFNELESEMKNKLKFDNKKVEKNIILLIERFSTNLNKIIEYQKKYDRADLAVKVDEIDARLSPLNDEETGLLRRLAAGDRTPEKTRLLARLEEIAAEREALLKEHTDKTAQIKEMEDAL